MQSKALAGTYIAMITPFSPSGALDVAGLRENIEWWIAEGVHGLIPSGSAGEFLQLSDEERADLMRITIETAAGRVPVVPGISSDWTAEAKQWALLAQSIGASGVMLSPPFYATPSEDELFAHYRTVAEATSLPIMVYNNPATTGIDMKPPFLERLSEIPTIRYVKESTRDVRRVEDIHRRTQGRLRVFAGIHALESLLVGAVGWVSVPANAAPRLSARLYDAAVHDANLEEARAISDRLWEIMELEDDTGKYVQVYKAALTLMGRPAGPPRLPRLSLAGKELDRLRKSLVAIDAIEAGSSPGGPIRKTSIGGQSRAQ